MRLKFSTTFHPQIDGWLMERDTEWAKHWGKQRGLIDIFPDEQFSAAPEDLSSFDEENL